MASPTLVSKTCSDRFGAVVCVVSCDTKECIQVNWFISKEPINCSSYVVNGFLMYARRRTFIRGERS